VRWCEVVTAFKGRLTWPRTYANTWASGWVRKAATWNPSEPMAAPSIALRTRPQATPSRSLDGSGSGVQANPGSRARVVSVLWYIRPVLIGREGALTRIARMVSGARAGRGGALLLRGEPGSGKTVLLAAAAADSGGMTVLRWARVRWRYGPSIVRECCDCSL